ncbi:DUF4136 domain-containing protein [Carboxylicivirga sp. N1Y90]|uniref:DUF4136 domain-containing protein n=1 Tax=Carboxylicivirga fragile TaxID=3417571 RepID=UPI003D34874D|nr:DUF4136 domain-containing protein [Marinilabiliaceae bacterium N1Y90]
MKNLTIIIAVIGLLTSCSSTKVSSDQVSNADFNAFTSYAIKQVEGTNESINPINTKRIENAIVNETEQRGLIQEKEAELEIVWGFGIDVQKSYSTNTNHYRTGGVGFRRGGYGMANSQSDTQEYTTATGVLQIAVVDTETDEVLWIGTAEDEFKGKNKKAEEKINAVIAKVFEEFPIDRTQS